MPKVLLVEDDEESRAILARHLRRKGYEVLIAVDGKQAIKMAHEEVPDLILMDMGLPALDGWEATRQLKADPETRAIPVVAVTAHAKAGDKEKALEAGCDDYEAKPLEFRGLLAKMKAIWARKSTPRGEEEDV